MPRFHMRNDGSVYRAKQAMSVRPRARKRQSMRSGRPRIQGVGRKMQTRTVKSPDSQEFAHFWDTLHLSGSKRATAKVKMRPLNEEGSGVGEFKIIKGRNKFYWSVEYDPTMEKLFDAIGEELGTGEFEITLNPPKGSRLKPILMYEIIENLEKDRRMNTPEEWDAFVKRGEVRALEAYRSGREDERGVSDEEMYENDGVMKVVSDAMKTSQDGFKAIIETLQKDKSDTAGYMTDMFKTMIEKKSTDKENGKGGLKEMAETIGIMMGTIQGMMPKPPEMPGQPLVTEKPESDFDKFAKFILMMKGMKEFFVPAVDLEEEEEEIPMDEGVTAKDVMNAKPMDLAKLVLYRMGVEAAPTLTKILGDVGDKALKSQSGVLSSVLSGTAKVESGEQKKIESQVDIDTVNMIDKLKKVEAAFKDERFTNEDIANWFVNNLPPFILKSLGEASWSDASKVFSLYVPGLLSKDNKVKTKELHKRMSAMVKIAMAKVVPEPKEAEVIVPAGSKEAEVVEEVGIFTEPEEIAVVSDEQKPKSVFARPKRKHRTEDL